MALMALVMSVQNDGSSLISERLGEKRRRRQWLVEKACARRKVVADQLLDLTFVVEGIQSADEM